MSTGDIKSSSNQEPQQKLVKLVVGIVPGKATEHQKKLWHDFWRRLVNGLKSER